MPDDTESFFLSLAVQRGVATRELAQECVEQVTRAPGGRGLLNLVVERARIPQDVARALHAEAVAMASRSRGPDVQRWVSGALPAQSNAGLAAVGSAAAPTYANGGAGFAPPSSTQYPPYSPAGVAARGPGATQGFGAPTQPAAGPGQTHGSTRGFAPSSGQPRTQADASTPASWGPGGSSAGRTAQAFQAGMVFGRYRLEQELGRGGMGVVWRARQVDLDRPVAIKMLLQGSFADDRRRQRFLAEAKAVARLSHPNIVAVHDVGEVDGVHYFTMDLVEGPSLAEALKSGPFDVDKALKVAAQIASGLEAAHRERLIHRDMKPANIILDPRGDPKITDFGIAKDLDAVSNTIEGEVLGTPAYMPPEQANGRKDLIDARADIYALGAILYRMVTGTPPFDGATPYDVITKVLSQDPPPMKASGRSVPRAVEAIALKCLSKKREDRYPSAEALREAIEKARQGVDTGTRPAVSSTGEGAPPGSRHVLIASVIAALLLLAAVGVVIQGWRDGRRREEELRLKAERDAAAQLALEQQKKDQEAALKRAAAAQKATAALERRAASPEQALADVRQAALDAPDAPAVLAALGQLLLEVGKDPGGALDALDRALKLDPGASLSRSLRARCLIDLERPAAEIDKEVAELDKQGPTGRALAAEVRAEQALRREEVASAVGHMDEAVGHDPRNVRLRQRLAEVLLRARRYASAEQEATKALEIDNRSAATLAVRAAAKNELGRVPEALRDCEDALKLDPKEPRANQLIRDLRAKAAAQRPPVRPPVGPGADHAAGHEHVHAALKAFNEAVRGNNPQEAVKQLNIALDPTEIGCPRAHLDRAHALMLFRKYQEAAQDLQRAERAKGSPLAEARELFADILMVASPDKKAEARAALDMALQLEPRRISALEGRARVLEQMGELETAKRDWDTAVEIGGPQDHRTVHERGHFYHRVKKFDEALADLNAALALAPQNAHYLTTRGDIHLDAGHKAEALADHKAARQHLTAPADIQRAEARIAEIEKLLP